MLFDLQVKLDSIQVINNLHVQLPPLALVTICPTQSAHILPSNAPAATNMQYRCNICQTFHCSLRTHSAHLLYMFQGRGGRLEKARLLLCCKKLEQAPLTWAQCDAWKFNVCSKNNCGGKRINEKLILKCTIRCELRVKFTYSFAFNYCTVFIYL